LRAFTVNVYVVPFVSDLTEQVSGPEVQLQRWAPVPEITTYPVMALPPVAGAIHETVALLLWGLAPGFDGAEGTPGRTTAVEGVERRLVPTAL
jgi:hypothetical protein